MPSTLSVQGFTTVNLVDAVNRALNRPSSRVRKSARLILSREDTDEEKLVDVTEGAQDILFTASTIFPLVLFPDTINMDRQKLTIIHRDFFRSANTISVQIDDILNVESNVGPFFGSIHVYSKFFTNDIKSISFLSRSNVLKIQRLIQGYIIAHHKKIDCSTIDKNQLLVLLNDLGQGTAD